MSIRSKLSGDVPIIDVLQREDNSNMSHFTVKLARHLLENFVTITASCVYMCEIMLLFLLCKKY
jgi:hypothetical protein